MNQLVKDKPDRPRDPFLLPETKIALARFQPEKLKNYKSFATVFSDRYKFGVMVVAPINGPKIND